MDTLVLGRGRALLLLVMALLVVLAARSARGALEDESNASMRSADEAQSRMHQAFVRDFGSDEMIVASLTHPDLLGRDGLAMLTEMTRRIAALEGVRRATSLCNVLQIVHGPEGAEPAPLIPDPLPTAAQLSPAPVPVHDPGPAISKPPRATS